MFNFPVVERKKGFSYKKHFLRSVIFQFQFEKIEILENKEEIINVVKPFFPRVNDAIKKGFEIKLREQQTPILKNIMDDAHGIEFRSEDGEKTLVIDSKSFTFTNNGKNYINFETLLEDINKIEKVFKILGIQKVNRIAIRKINIIEFAINNIEKENPSEALEYTLNPELISNLNYYPDIKFIRRNLQTINFHKGQDRLNLNYGLVVLPNLKTGQIVIDIDLFTLSVNEFDRVLSVAKNINDEIFNIFHWAISKNIEELLVV